MIDFSFNYNNDFKGDGFDIFILYLVKHIVHPHNPIWELFWDFGVPWALKLIKYFDKKFIKIVDVQ